MAVDTRNKRMSMIGLGSPVPALLPDPDASFSADDRAQLLWLYHDTFNLAAIIAVPVLWFVLHLMDSFSDVHLVESFRDANLVDGSHDLEIR